MANGDVSAAGVQFVARWEGFRANLYNDATGIATIGYGHLVHRGPINGSEAPNLRDGITPQEGLNILHRDLAVAVAAVNNGVHVPLTQHKFDALVSFTFNVGAQAFHDSTLLTVVNKPDHAAVPAQLARWTNHGLAGLVNRRRAEAALYVDGTYD